MSVDINPRNPGQAWVMIHEIPEEDWIVNRLTVTELKVKLSGAEKQER